MVSQELAKLGGKLRSDPKHCALLAFLYSTEERGRDVCQHVNSGSPSLMGL